MQKNFCVDLDGTLINTDMLWESILYQIKKNPFVILFVFLWLLKGKTYLKQKLADKFDFDPELLPYNQEVIELIKNRRKHDSKVYLVSASYESIVKKIHDYFSDELFDGYYATGGKPSIEDQCSECINLSSHNKAAFLNKVFGDKKYDYVGNSGDDIAVWNECGRAYIFAGRKKSEKFTSSLKNLNYEVVGESAGKNSCKAKNCLVRLVLKQIRIHQWAKNVLIFCPAFAVHAILPVGKYGELIVAFISFCFLTSSVYIINDLLDLWNDRAHERKKNRPLASGNLSIPSGIVIAVLCILLCSAMSLFLSVKFFLFEIIYFAVNLFYSIRLKNVVALDCVLLACMYTYRIFLGCVASELDYSLWLFSFAVFLFLSLALIKRYIELHNLQKKGIQSIAGRAYTVSDIPVISAMYVSFGTLSVLVFAMYLNSEEIRNSFSSIWYAYSSLIFILYWMIYLFIKTARGEIDDDPVLFVLKDKVSLFLGFVFVLLFCLGAVL